MAKKYLVRIRSDFMRWFENIGVAPHAIIEADNEIEAERTLDENGINYELYVATVVTDSGQHPTLCIEVNGKNYCREGGE